MSDDNSNCTNNNNSLISIDESTKIYLKCRGYSIENQIGIGTYGIVFNAKKLSDDKKNEISIAVKVIDKSKKIYNKEMYQNEIRAMGRLKNDNIIRSYALFEMNKLIMIFMDLAEDGDLLTLLLRNGALCESDSQRYFKQIASGLNYMHEICWMAHLDTKCDNILLQKGIAKLSDFGFTSEFCPIYTNENFQTKRVGTFEYNPPQLMHEKPCYFPPKVDVYSAGITLFIMVFGRFLFLSVEKSIEKRQKDIRDQQLNYLNVINTKLSDKYSNELRELLIKMLNPNEIYRPEMKEILNDHWLEIENFSNIDHSREIQKYKNHHTNNHKINDMSIKKKQIIHNIHEKDTTKNYELSNKKKDINKSRTNKRKLLETKVSQEIEQQKIK